MDNRPVSIKTPIIAFRQSELSFKITYTNLPQMPDEISAQFWVGTIQVHIQDAVISGNQATFSIPPTIVSTLPDSSQVYFLHDGVSKFGGNCSVNMGMAPNPSTLELSVTLGGNQEFLVELVAMDAINEQVDAAREYAEQANLDKIQTGQDRVATAQDRIQTGEDRVATGNDKADAETARQGAETAKQDAEDAAELARSGVRTRIPTFAQMLALCLPDQARDFTVIFDEFQEDENVPYVWDGSILFEYNGFDICEQQP